MFRKIVWLPMMLICCSALAFSQAKTIPQLVKKGDKYTLLVDGKPFIMLGGQVNNPSATPERMARAWPKLKSLNANTVEFPVYWRQLEPAEGRFDFGDFDLIIAGARAQGLRVVPLWFGTWKNGNMDYTPTWMKADTVRFPRVLDFDRKPIGVLSPHSRTNLEADRRAYTALVRHIREIDEKDRTVIMMQVENEAGTMGSIRDFSAEGERLFNGPVPAALVKSLRKKPGTWKEVFGSRMAEEAFAVYSLATYINEVARAGKQIYPLPTYVNVWMGGNGTNDGFNRWDYPGEGYPSGGAVSHVLDLWKASAPDIDLIAPDIYHSSPLIFRQILTAYRRADNPLFIPETGPFRTAHGLPYARNLFYALAEFSAIGFAPYGVDSGTGTEVNPPFAEHAANFRLIRSAVPVIAQLQGTGKLKAAVEEDSIGSRMLCFDQFDMLVRFPSATRPSGETGPSEPTGRVLIGELAPGEFLILGFDAGIEFRPALGSGYTKAQLVLLEEGAYADGVWKRTGESRTGLTSSANLPSAGSMLRVKLTRQ